MSCQFPTIFQDAFTEVETTFQNAFNEVQRHLANIGKQIDQHVQIPKAVQAAFTEIKEATENVVDTIFSHTAEALTIAFDIAGEVRREIDFHIDQNLDPRIASVAKAALSGLPVTLALLALPYPWPPIVIGAYLIAKVLQLPTKAEEDALDAAVAMRHLALAANHIAQAIMHRNEIAAVAGAVHTIGAIVWALANPRFI
jgi:hypothetical protein